MQDFSYPEDVAFPIGGPGTPEYMVIEMHYDNPNFDAGIYVHNYAFISIHSCVSFILVYIIGL